MKSQNQQRKRFLQILERNNDEAIKVTVANKKHNIRVIRGPSVVFEDSSNGQLLEIFFYVIKK